MSKNDENENVHVERLDNTRVRRPVLQNRILRASPAKQIESYLKIYGVPQLPVLSADTRTPELKEINRKAGELELYRLKEEEQKQLNRLIALGIGATGAIIGSQFTPAAPYVNAALAAHSGVNLAEQYHEGTLGFNIETALNTLGFTPYGVKALPYVSKAGAKAGEYLGKAGTYIREQSPIFIPAKNSFTRGIGRGTEGITDLVSSGVVRGNPRGTEVTAHLFAKLWRNNRLHFQDIMKDTGISNIEQKFFSRNLNKEEFDAIKNAASKYNVGNSLSAYPVSLRTISTDPLSEYNSYDDYIKAVQQLVSEVESMTGKIKSGEVKVNTKLLEHENGLPTGTPIEERFGPNSDYVGDGHPLTYWYPDGRNPFRRGYDYAGSDWGVRVLNADTQTPFMHDLHLHPSFFYTPKLNSPNVLVFRRLPFGLGLRVPKNWVKSKFGETLASIGNGSTLNAFDGATSTGEAVKQGIKQAREYFRHPIVLETVEKNRKLSERIFGKPARNMGWFDDGTKVTANSRGEVLQHYVDRPVNITTSTELPTGFLGDYNSAIPRIRVKQGMNPYDTKRTVFHEGLHHSGYGNFEGGLYDLKAEKLFGIDDYLVGHEAAVNTAELGRIMGLEIGQKYPGYEAFKKMLSKIDPAAIDKKFMFDKVILNTPRDYKRFWDALTGKYFTPTAIGIGTSSLIPSDKKDTKNK